LLANEKIEYLPSREAEIASNFRAKSSRSSKFTGTALRAVSNDLVLAGGRDDELLFAACKTEEIS
jgi:hypothetical protein